MKAVEFHPQAQDEFSEIVAFYDRESANLGDEFTTVVELAVEFVRTHPRAGSPLRGELRRWQVRRFPYTLIYREEPERIYVLALAHHRRQPGYWLHRV